VVILQLVAKDVFISANGAFDGGIFAWLGMFTARRFHQGKIGMGLALAGYSIPDSLFGFMIGSWADRYGRRYVVPIGFFWKSVYAPFLVWHSTPLISVLIRAALSVGFDVTHPLMSSFTTLLDPKPRGKTVDNALMEYG
jgi:MFS family permease